MKPIILCIFSSLFLALPSYSASTSFASFHCEGFAIEAGKKRRLSATEEFREHSVQSRLAEVSFGFRFSKASRMNLQIRALEGPQDLQVATTFLEISTEPLGKVESAFFERVFFAKAKGEYFIEKNFADLQFELSCKTVLDRAATHRDLRTQTEY
jgi:hypothetical protein